VGPALEEPVERDLIYPISSLAWARFGTASLSGRVKSVPATYRLIILTGEI